MPEVHIKRDYSVPAAIQFMNPGAMWPNDRATKWGSTKWQYLSDGTGQGGGGHGNKIAIFDNWVDGICAQLDLWRSSPNYRNKTLAAALQVWSGGNHVESYIAYVTARVPGMTRDTVMNDAFWSSPKGLLFLKAQAGHEAGKAIPATDADWAAAQKRVFAGKPPTSSAQKKVVVAGSAGGGAVVVAHQGGFGVGTALCIGLAIALVIFLVWYFKNRKVDTPAPVAVPVVAADVPAVPIVKVTPEVPHFEGDLATAASVDDGEPNK